MLKLDAQFDANLATLLRFRSYKSENLFAHDINAAHDPLFVRVNYALHQSCALLLTYFIKYEKFQTILLPELSSYLLNFGIRKPSFGWPFEAHHI
jgi:hypothetical protein